MATVEEKLDKLAEDVLKIGVEQVKGFSKLDHLNSWSITAEKTTTELRESISDLTSRMTTLEAMFTKAPLKVPPREEEGRVNGHGVHISQQGQESRGGPWIPPCSRVCCNSLNPHTLFLVTLGLVVNPPSQL
jgi:hypothetical protein